MTRNQGFTLTELIVSLALTWLLFALTFALSEGGKRMATRVEERRQCLQRAVELLYCLERDFSNTASLAGKSASTHVYRLSNDKRSLALRLSTGRVLYQCKEAAPYQLIRMKDGREKHFPGIGFIRFQASMAGDYTLLIRVQVIFESKGFSFPLERLFRIELPFGADGKCSLQKRWEQS